MRKEPREEKFDPNFCILVVESRLSIMAQDEGDIIQAFKVRLSDGCEHGEDGYIGSATIYLGDPYIAESNKVMRTDMWDYSEDSEELERVGLVLDEHENEIFALVDVGLFERHRIWFVHDIEIKPEYHGRNLELMLLKRFFQTHLRPHELVIVEPGTAIQGNRQWLKDMGFKRLPDTDFMVGSCSTMKPTLFPAINYDRIAER